ncbi:hypothetical protein DH2020_023283 [Rehmannia glutinosa]|uniref:Integrase catalytic domain-containing protein n=1 Tax=Rehmannia glutinosa TaxID=99300 RepID=A0ABR0W9Y9_REHGL
MSEQRGRSLCSPGAARGACGSHGGSELLAQKARRAGYFVLGLKKILQKVVKTCEKCRKHGPLIHKPFRTMERSSRAKELGAPAGIKVTQHFTSVAHPQANGQVEVTNRTLVRGLKARLERAGGGWVDELQSVLWSYRTSPKEATGKHLLAWCMEQKLLSSWK